MRWTTLVGAVSALGVGLFAVGSVAGLAGFLADGTFTTGSVAVLVLVAVVVAATTAVGILGGRFLDSAHYW